MKYIRGYSWSRRGSTGKSKRRRTNREENKGTTNSKI